MKKVEINGIMLSEETIDTIRRFQEENNMMTTELVRILDDYIALRAWIGINVTEGTSINEGPKSTLLDIQSTTELKSMILKLKV